MIETLQSGDVSTWGALAVAVVYYLARHRR